MTDKVVNLNVRINDNTRKKFKAYTSMNGETMTDVILELIENYIKENENKMG